jgi:uncharacterized membrane protein HdeD (DUF308 family)
MFKRLIQGWFRTPGKHDWWMFVMLCAIPLLFATVLLWMHPVSALLLFSTLLTR